MKKQQQQHTVKLKLLCVRERVKILIDFDDIQFENDKRNPYDLLWFMFLTAIIQFMVTDLIVMMHITLHFWKSIYENVAQCSPNNSKTVLTFFDSCNDLRHHHNYHLTNIHQKTKRKNEKILVWHFFVFVSLEITKEPKSILNFSRFSIHIKPVLFIKHVTHVVKWIN